MVKVNNFLPNFYPKCHPFWLHFKQFSLNNLNNLKLLVYTNEVVSCLSILYLLTWISNPRWKSVTWLKTTRQNQFIQILNTCFCDLCDWIESITNEEEQWLSYFSTAPGQYLGGHRTSRRKGWKALHPPPGERGAAGSRLLAMSSLGSIPRRWGRGWGIVVIKVMTPWTMISASSSLWAAWSRVLL